MIYKFFICHINLAFWQLESEIRLACDIGCELPKWVLGTQLRSTTRTAALSTLGFLSVSYFALVLEIEPWALCMLMLGKHSTTKGHPSPGTCEDLSSEQVSLEKGKGTYKKSIHTADFGRLLITTDFPRSAIQVKHHSRIFKGKFIYFHNLFP